MSIKAENKRSKIVQEEQNEIKAHHHIIAYNFIIFKSYVS